MAKRLQLRRGTTAEHSTFAGAVGEVTVDTDKDTVVVHDGSTFGGTPLATSADNSLKADTTYVNTELDTKANINATVNTVNTLADLRARTEPLDRVFVSGYYEKGDGAFGSNIFEWDATSTENDNGGTIIKLASIATGRYKLRYSGAVNVKWFGAKGDGVTDDTTALNSLISFNINNIVFSKGTYVISEPLHFNYSVNITGDKAIIQASNTFIGKSFTDVGNSTTVTLYGCIINILGDYNDTGGARLSASIFSGLDFQCNDRADGIIIERFMDSIIEKCNIYEAKDYGILNSTYTWGSRFNNVRIEGFATAGIYLGTASNGLDISGVVIWGYPVRGDYGIQSVGNNNGIAITGSVIERVGTGVYLDGRFGSISISGVDFEDTTNYNIYGNCPDFAENRLAGPLSVSGCYFDSNSENIKNNIAMITTEGCRFRTSPHFISDSVYGVNVSTNNVFDGFVPVVSGGRFKSETNTSTGRVVEKIYNFNTSVDYKGHTKEYYLSNHQPTARSGYMNILGSSQGGAADLHTAKLQLAAISTAYTDSEYNTTLIEINNIGSNRSLAAGNDNAISLGTASNRWTTVYAATGTINTSDDREKTYLTIDETETLAAKELKGLVKKFKFNDAIEAKGEDNARIHYGTSAQSVIEVFKKHNLDPMKYAMICFDEWYELEGEIIEPNEDGTYPEGSVKKDRYGIRYEELIMFIIGGL